MSSNPSVTEAETSQLKKPPLDEHLYNPDPEELAFFQQETKLSEADLKSHLLDVQTRAYEIYPYPCIRRFMFTKLKISRLPAYQKVLAIGRERNGAIFLDLGCCFGNDTRKVILDGFPITGVIASDLRKEFWDLGHELFKSTPESFPVPFITGDAFDPSILKSVPPFYSSPETSIPDLKSLKSLNPLLGHVSAIHASSFFHLFDEEEQFKLAKAVAGLLSPIPGSIIFGSHVGAPVKGVRQSSSGRNAYAHSPESWDELWDGQIFVKGKVKVEAELKTLVIDDATSGDSSKRALLTWSVTRL